MGAVPDLPLGCDRLHGEPDVASSRSPDKDPALAGQAGRHRSVRVQGLQAGRVVHPTKNPNYWNKPYPYLDEVEFRVILMCSLAPPHSRPVTST